jgi:hypothetical protein
MKRWFACYIWDEIVWFHPEAMRKCNCAAARLPPLRNHAITTWNVQRIKIIRWKPLSPTACGSCSNAIRIGPIPLSRFQDRGGIRRIFRDNHPRPVSLAGRCEKPGSYGLAQSTSGLHQFGTEHNPQSRQVDSGIWNIWCNAHHILFPCCQS